MKLLLNKMKLLLKKYVEYEKLFSFFFEICDENKIIYDLVQIRMNFRIKKLS